MTGTFASRAFFISTAIFGTDATQVGRGEQITDVMSRTRRAAPFTGISTVTGSGIFGIGEVAVGGDGEMLGVATCGVGDVTAAGGVVNVTAAGVPQAARSVNAVTIGIAARTNGSMASSLSEAGELPLPDDRVQQCGPAFLADHVDGPPERRTDVLRIRDRALAVPAERLREHREVRGGDRELHADVGLHLVSAEP